MANLPRVFISTDLRLSSEEKDDAQSLIHALLYQDKFDIVGIAGTASKWGHQNGRVQDIDTIIDVYGKVYSKLAAKSSAFKTVSELKAVSHQGATSVAPAKGYSSATESSKAIIAEAKKAAAAGEKLNVLTWGGETDLAQALHDDPSIAQHVRFFNISNQDEAAYKYILNTFKGKLDMWVDNQTTFRGMHNEPEGRSLIKGWHDTNAKGHGALGDFFASLSGDIFNESGVKMGDSPTVLRFISGNQNDPTQESWGGEFRYVSKGYYTDKTSEAFNWGPTGGARTIYEDRDAWLSSFAERFDWLKDGSSTQTPVSKPTLPADSETTPAPNPGKSELKLVVSGDHFNGAPRMDVHVDGVKVGTYTVSADHKKGAWQTVVINGDWADGKDHDVKVSFTNDSYGGTSATDRNLWVKSASMNGVTTGKETVLKSNGSLTWKIDDTPSSTPTPTPSPKEDTITVKVSGDAFLGAPNFALIVDGKTIDSTNLVTADRKKGESQTFTFKGNFDNDGVQSHKVGIAFTNDKYAGSSTADRNLFVEEVTFNGVKNDADHLYKWNGTFYWNFDL